MYQSQQFVPDNAIKSWKLVIITIINVSYFIKIMKKKKKFTTIFNIFCNHRNVMKFCYFIYVDKEPMNAYCWIYSTFTVSKHLRGIPGRDVASPGVGQALENDEIYHHRYYQWVSYK